MHIGHQPVVVADAGNAFVLHGAAIEGAIFADGVAITDVERRGLALIFLVLVGLAQRDKMENAVVAADTGMAGDHGMMADGRALADFHIAVDNAVCTNADVGAQAGARIDDGGRMDPSAYAMVLMGQISPATHATRPL